MPNTFIREWTQKIQPLSPYEATVAKFEAYIDRFHWTTKPTCRERDLEIIQATHNPDHNNASNEQELSIFDDLARLSFEEQHLLLLSEIKNNWADHQGAANLAFIMALEGGIKTLEQLSKILLALDDIHYQDLITINASKLLNVVNGRSLGNYIMMRRPHVESQAICIYLDMLVRLPREAQNNVLNCRSGIDYGWTIHNYIFCYANTETLCHYLINFENDGITLTGMEHPFSTHNESFYFRSGWRENYHIDRQQQILHYINQLLTSSFKSTLLTLALDRNTSLSRFLCHGHIIEPSYMQSLNSLKETELKAMQAKRRCELNGVTSSQGNNGSDREEKKILAQEQYIKDKLLTPLL